MNLKFIKFHFFSFHFLTAFTRFLQFMSSENSVGCQTACNSVSFLKFIHILTTGLLEFGGFFNNLTPVNKTEILSLNRQT